ncbi:MAG: tRNA (adenosine(37)-N6)-threonylcarbamoyltransferase complex dimerization subunit type 1 TsaB [Thermoguttaceae bacterium]|nr:tRNA (adenosine(37)-N6)-threonylcarbamoyltransferase complex dimerization subunit type 1 TsaB [Thermoguttaceae bacterium]
MKILAIETTDLTGGVALLEDDVALCARELDSNQRSARSLAPAIRDVLRDFSWTPDEVDVVAVVKGPGSFTGLRVGTATAKAFAWSVGARIVGVDSLDAAVADLEFERLREAAPSDTSKFVLSVALDAQRGDVAFRNYLVSFAAESLSVFSLNSRFGLVSRKKWSSVAPTLYSANESSGIRDSFFPLAPQSELDGVGALDGRGVVFAGPALDESKNRAGLWGEPSPRAILGARPSALGAAKIALESARAGHFDDLWGLLPVYSRLAAAEERALAKAACEGR